MVQILYAFKMANKSLPEPFDHSKRREYSRKVFSNVIRKILFDVRPAAEAIQIKKKTRKEHALKQSMEFQVDCVT